MNVQIQVPPNIAVERDRRQAGLAGSLRGFAAPAAPHLKRYASNMFARPGSEARNG